MSSNKELRSIAYHEAGHIAAAHLLNLPVYRATIEPSDNSLGRVVTFYEDDIFMWPDPTRRKESARRHVISLYAGLVAQRLVDPSARWNGGARFDYRIARKLTRDFVFDAVALRGEARRLIHSHQGLVKMYADALLNHGSLDDQALCEIAKNCGVDTIDNGAWMKG